MGLYTGCIFHHGFHGLNTFFTQKWGILGYVSRRKLQPPPFSLFVSWGPLGRERNDGCGKVWVCDQSVSDTVHREMAAAEKDWLISIDLVASKLANDDINDDINDLSSTKTDNG